LELIKIKSIDDFYDYEYDSNLEIAFNQKGITIRDALLNFVDLAGSEKVSNHY